MPFFILHTPHFTLFQFTIFKVNKKIILNVLNCISCVLVSCPENFVISRLNFSQKNCDSVIFVVSGFVGMMGTSCSSVLHQTEFRSDESCLNVCRLCRFTGNS